jgi:putative component of membrane protein insertase Oxa1/YidC/SpoIIIJ protein YidD
LQSWRNSLSNYAKPIPEFTILQPAKWAKTTALILNAARGSVYRIDRIARCSPWNSGSPQRAKGRHITALRRQLRSDPATYIV